MPTIELVRITPDLAALVADPAAFAAAYGASLGDQAALVSEILTPTLNLPGAHATPWGGYLAIDPSAGQVIGTCAFKGPPVDGAVELAYYTFPAFEGRGYGGAMARSLIAFAEAMPEVELIIAYTLPESNASTRILTRAGLRFTGEVIDPEDGRVWRWERPARSSI